MTARRPGTWLSWLGVGALVALSLILATGTRDAPSSEDRVAHLAGELRCPVCQGLSVADSDAETSRQIRADIEQRIADGQSDAEIRQAYVARYGQWILLRPSGRGVGAVVWLLPAAIVGAAAVGLVLVYRRRRRAWPHAASEPDRDVVQRARRLAGDAET